MAALSTIHDITCRRLVSSIYSWDIYAYTQAAKYVLDTDTGVDDAMALLQILAARKKNQASSFARVT
jgi:hypothetical protein